MEAWFYDADRHPGARIELFPDDDLGDYTHHYMLKHQLQWPREAAIAHYDEARDWCLEHIGPQNIKWAEAGFCLSFRDVDAAFQFKLRWC
ncbi:MAG: hypothetical protein EOP83_06010 [Verrucomicrobiaceae bacterium]|nr:MAG: hypothetical protein EOP83_06010 [Verrucomicrobiaceae bacterium]